MSDKLNFIPTFGWPASDVLLASAPGTTLPLVPIGRLGVVNGGEVNNYLLKIKQYEQAQQTPGSTIVRVNYGWKNFIHVAGGKNTAENDEFRAYMNNYKAIAEDSLTGCTCGNIY